MRVFISLTNSTKQVIELQKFLDKKKEKLFFHVFVTFDLQDQTRESQLQYRNALKSLRRTVFLPLKIYSKLHRIILLLCRFTSVEVILGNILGFFCRDYFESSGALKKPIVILDDGLISISIAKLVVDTNRVKEFVFATSYKAFMPRVIVQENNRKFVEDDLSSKFLFDNKTLGVFGGPLVESGFIELKMLRAMIHEASARMNCEKIFYYMHRREKLKFKCDSITEIISENSDSLSLILRKKEIPLYWWSIFSSAMVDLAILNIKPLVFSYSPLRDIEAMRNPYLARHGVNTVETIYEIYGKLGFYCIL